MTAHPDPHVHWKNRRRMAYTLGVFWGIAQTVGWTVLAVMAPEALALLNGVIGWSYSLAGLALAAYYGGNAAEAVWGRK